VQIYHTAGEILPVQGVPLAGIGARRGGIGGPASIPSERQGQGVIDRELNISGALPIDRRAVFSAVAFDRAQFARNKGRLSVT
jgi:hypothetical protein